MFGHFTVVVGKINEIININNCFIYGFVLFKGHRKPKTPCLNSPTVASDLVSHGELDFQNSLSASLCHPCLDSEHLRDGRGVPFRSALPDVTEEAYEERQGNP